LIFRAAVLILALFLTSNPSAAQDNRAAARDLVKKWQDAIVNVKAFQGFTAPDKRRIARVHSTALRNGFSVVSR